VDPHDLTLLLAVGAGVISFLSPCVLPLVPAYLGQLAVVTVGSARPTGTSERGAVLAAAAAYVVGFGLVFTILGATASYIFGPLRDDLPLLRQIGGVALVILGLSIAGILPIPILERSWRPLDVAAAGHFQRAAASAAAAPVTNAASADESPTRRSTWAALASSFLLGLVFAIGWTPCIGPILGAILTVAATGTTVAQGTLLLVAYSAGLAVPFLVLALVFDRAPAIVRLLVRHGRTVSLVGGLLVAGMGVLIFFDVLFGLYTIFSRYLPFVGV
jgi:cytochrome c-type biogenesis protein